MRVLYLSEFWPVIRSRWRGAFLFGVALFATLFFSLLFLFEPVFRADASFQKKENPKEGESLLLSLRKGSGGSNPKHVMQSRAVLNEVVAKVGLQMVEEGSRWRDALTLLRCEAASVLPRSSWEIRNVYYDGAEPLSLTLRKVGDSYVRGGADVSFEVVSMPDHERATRFTLLPKRAAIHQLKKQLKIKRMIDDRNLFVLNYSHRKRETAIDTLNEVMEAYRELRQKEHEFLGQKQLAYLEKRRDALAMRFGGGALADEQLENPRNRFLAERESLDLFAKDLQHSQLLAGANPPYFQEPLEPIDLDTVQSLLSRGRRELEDIHHRLDEVKALYEKTLDPQFPLSALSDDPLASKVSELEMKLKGTSYTAIERERVQRELDEHRERLQAHLKNRIDLLNLEREGVERGLARTQSLASTLVSKKRGTLNEKLDELNAEMRRLSESKMKRELAMQVMESITKLTESKVVDHHLFQVASIPLDVAEAPLALGSFHLLLYSSMGGITGAFLWLLTAMVFAVVNGLPVSKKMLEDRGYQTLQPSIETPLRLLLSIQEGEVIALIGTGLGKDVIHHLAINGRNPLWVKVGTDEPLQQCDGHGAVSLSSLFSASLSEEIAGWKKTFGCIVIDCEGSPDGVHALSTIPHADRIIVDAIQRKEEAIEPYSPEKTVCLVES